MTFIGIISSFLRKADTISREPQLRINNSTRFSTEIGGILSIFLYFFFLFYFVSRIREANSMRYSSISFIQETITSDEEQFALNDYKQGFFLALLIKTKTGAYFNDIENISGVNMTSYILEENNTVSQTYNLNEKIFIKCGDSNSTDKIQKSKAFDNYKNKVLNGICIKPSNKTIYLSDFLSRDLSFSRKLKMNFDFNNIEVESIEILFESINELANIKNLLIKKYSTEMNNKIYKKLDVVLTKSEIITDDGFILDKSNQKNKVFVTKIKEDVLEYNNKIPINKFQIEISLSDIKFIYFKKYQKLQLVFAEMGGLAKFLFFIAYALNFIHNNTRFYEKLISEIFDARDLKKSFPFQETETKTIYNKYRNSITLKRTKDFEIIKREHSNISLVPKLNNFTNNHSKNNLSHLSTKKFPSTMRLQPYEDHKFPRYVSNPAYNVGNVCNSSNNHNNKLAEIEETVTNDFFSIVQNQQKADTYKNQNNNTGAHLNTNSNYYKELLRGSKKLSRKEESPLFTHEILKNNKKFKNIFDKVKNEKFYISFGEIFLIRSCFQKCRKQSTWYKKSILETGKCLVNKKLDVVSLIKRNLDFDRFKNLVLKDHQLILLNSLSRFMLDPETVNLVDFNNITFEKLTEALVHANPNSVIDYNLREFVKLKYELDLKPEDTEEL